MAMVGGEGEVEYVPHQLVKVRMPSCDKTLTLKHPHQAPLRDLILTAEPHFRKGMKRASPLGEEGEGPIQEGDIGTWQLILEGHVYLHRDRTLAGCGLGGRDNVVVQLHTDMSHITPDLEVQVHLAAAAPHPHPPTPQLTSPDPAGFGLSCVQLVRKLGPEGFAEAYKLTLRQHGRHQNLHQFCYTRKSRMEVGAVQECRGIILDRNAMWLPVAMPYRKFFNIHEKGAAKVDWGDGCVVAEKLDGSMATLYYYQGEWQVASMKVPDAKGQCNTGMTFSDLFWDIWHATKMRLPEGEDAGNCYVFEMCTDRQKIVISHDQERIVLHGVRDMSTLRELPFRTLAEKYGWPATKTFPLSTRKEVEAAAKILNGFEAEGFVICDSSFNRVKVKSPHYVLVHHGATTNETVLRNKVLLSAEATRDNKDGGGRAGLSGPPRVLGDSDLTSIVCRGEVDEFACYHPKYAGRLHELSTAFQLAQSAYDTALSEVTEFACQTTGKKRGNFTQQRLREWVKRRERPAPTPSHRPPPSEPQPPLCPPPSAASSEEGGSIQESSGKNKGKGGARKGKAQRKEDKKLKKQQEREEKRGARRKKEEEGESTAFFECRGQTPLGPPLDPEVLWRMYISTLPFAELALPENSAPSHICGLLRKYALSPQLESKVEVEVEGNGVEVEGEGEAGIEKGGGGILGSPASTSL